MKSFAEFELLPSLQKTLVEKSLLKPTEIQVRAIPALLDRKNVVGVSETGSGKTLAYALPLLDYLKRWEQLGENISVESRPRALVLVPTRELGEQIARVFKTLTHDTRLRVRMALGGTPFEQSRRNVASVFEILLATPGRLLQLMEAKVINLDDIRTLIFDEADQMIDEGFLPDSQRVVERLAKDVQLGLFSATVSPQVQSLIDKLFGGAEVIRSAGSGKVVKTLVTKNLNVVNGKRGPLLEKLLKDDSDGGTILFVNTREQCDRLADDLRERGYKVGVYRGETNQNERRAILRAFRAGDLRLLVSTDLGGRGLDIEHVDRVVNVILPQTMENYIHRVGRTARAGRAGTVYNLVTERDEPLMAQLEGRKPVVKAPPKREPANEKSKRPAPRRPGVGRVARPGKSQARR